MTDYLLCGWRVRSALPLPELSVWPGADDTSVTPDIDIAWDTLPPHPPGAPDLHLTDPRAAYVNVPDVARFMVADGCRIGIAPSIPPGDTTPDEMAIRLYLLGTVFAILCYQRGVVPFHASALIPDPSTSTRAIMIAGDSGAGKSTLAATLAMRGAPILADDVCVLDTTTPHETRVLPAIARIKLWSDALDRLGISTESLPRVRRGMDKYAWFGIPATHTTPAPLAAIYHLTRHAESSPPRLAPTVGFAAATTLYKCLYRPYIGTTLGHDTTIARCIMHVISSTPVFTLSRNPAATEGPPLDEHLIAHAQTLA